jgi:hypothetical protein
VSIYRTSIGSSSNFTGSIRSERPALKNEPEKMRQVGAQKKGTKKRE